MKKEIILIMKFIPAPAYSGGAKRNLAWLRFLSHYYKVNLVGFFDKTYGDNMIDELKSYGISIYGFKFQRNLLVNTLKSVFLNKSLINLQYYDKNITKKISEIIKKSNIEFIMCEELAMMNYCYALKLPIYFDDHNIEHILMERTARHSAFPLRMFLHRESKLIKKEELLSFNKAKKIFVVSDYDKKQTNEMYHKKIFVVNNVYEKQYEKDNTRVEKAIVFVGNVSWKPNLYGLQHFIKNVYSKVLEKDGTVLLKIVGSSIPKKIKQFKSDNIIFYENVSEELKKEVIDSSMVGIVPIYFGGGTRIKILEYWAHTKPVISTKTGAEGLISSSGTYICDDDNDDEFASAIVEVISDRKLCKKAGKENLKTFVENYCEEKVYESTLYNTINTK